MGTRVTRPSDEDAPQLRFDLRSDGDYYRRVNWKSLSVQTDIHVVGPGINFLKRFGGRWR